MVRGRGRVSHNIVIQTFHVCLLRIDNGDF